jgi:hypothetical protein
MAAWLLQIVRPWVRVMVLLSALGLTACIQYDLDLQFDSQTHGQVVQRLQWQGGESVAQLQAWQQPLRERVKAVGGKVRSPQPGTLEVILPFYSGPDLVQRFNQFLSAETAQPPLTLPTGEAIQGHLDLLQGNWIVAIHNTLTLSLDLRGVPDGASLPTPGLQRVQWFTGDLTLTTPWGLKAVQTAPSPGGNEFGHSTNHWSLVPGQVNTLTARFWVPSPIGIGAIAISLLGAIGYLLKYRLHVGDRLILQDVKREGR